MSGNGLMNDAWLGQTVEPPKTGQTRPAASGVGAKTFLPWKRVQEAFFFMAGHSVLDGSKLPRRPRTIKPLLNKGLKFRQDVRQRLDERCLARSNSRAVQNGTNPPCYFRYWDANSSALWEEPAAY
jgi:hypothetical protein